MELFGDDCDIPVQIPKNAFGSPTFLQIHLLLSGSSDDSPHPEATNESLYKSCVQPVIDAVLDLEILRTQDVA